MRTRSPLTRLLLLAALCWAFCACVVDGPETSCSGVVGCTFLAETDTTFHEWGGLDTLMFPDSTDPEGFVQAVVSIPAGCGVLDSMFQERRGDTLVVRPRLFYLLYKDVNCAHGPYAERVFLGPAARILQDVSWVSYLRSRRGTADTNLVRPVPTIRRP